MQVIQAAPINRNPKISFFMENYGFPFLTREIELHLKRNNYSVLSMNVAGVSDKGKTKIITQKENVIFHEKQHELFYETNPFSENLANMGFNESHAYVVTDLKYNRNGIFPRIGFSYNFYDVFLKNFEMIRNKRRYNVEEINNINEIAFLNGNNNEWVSFLKNISNLQNYKMFADLYVTRKKDALDITLDAVKLLEEDSPDKAIEYIENIIGIKYNPSVNVYKKDMLKNEIVNINEGDKVFKIYSVDDLVTEKVIKIVKSNGIEIRA